MAGLDQQRPQGKQRRAQSPGQCEYRAPRAQGHAARGAARHMPEPRAGSWGLPWKLGSSLFPPPGRQHHASSAVRTCGPWSGASWLHSPCRANGTLSRAEGTVPYVVREGSVVAPAGSRGHRPPGVGQGSWPRLGLRRTAENWKTVGPKMKNKGSWGWKRVREEPGRPRYLHKENSGSRGAVCAHRALAAASGSGCWDQSPVLGG